MGGSAGRAARRLACYIDAIGDRPALTERGFRRDYQALLAQYTALPLLVRKEARRKGRSIIRGAGLGAAMAKLIPAQEQPSLHTAGKASRAEEIALLMAQSLGRCPGEAGLSQPRTSPGLFTIQWRHVLADLQVRQSRFLPPRSSTSHGGSRILLLSTPKLWHKQRTLKRLSQVCNAEECALPNDYLSKSTNERLRISAERRHERKLRRAGKQAVKLSHPSVGGHALWIMESITPQSFIAEMPQTSWWNLRRLNESLAGKWSWPDRW